MTTNIHNCGELRTNSKKKKKQKEKVTNSSAFKWNYLWGLIVYLTLEVFHLLILAMK